MWSPLENLRFGLSYRSRINHNADGDLTLSDSPAVGTMLPESFDATATISTPAWLMATAAWDVNDLLSLYATFRWTDWSSFDELTIKTNNPMIGDSIKNKWQDTYLVSVGADLRVTNWWTIRSTARPSFLMQTVCGLPWALPLRLPKTCKLMFRQRGSMGLESVICGIKTRLAVQRSVSLKTLTPTSSVFSWSTSSNLV